MEHNTKDKLLLSALEMFALHGFNATTTRMIAEHAGCNIGSIKYYFEDKKGLYEAVYKTYLGVPSLSISDTMSVLEGFQEITQLIWKRIMDSPYMDWCLKLHMQENINPLGLWEHDVNHIILPHHKALMNLMRRDAPHLSDQEILYTFYGCLSVLMSLHFHKDTMTKHGAIDINHWLAYTIQQVEWLWKGACQCERSS